MTGHHRPGVSFGGVREAQDNGYTKDQRPQRRPEARLDGCPGCVHNTELPRSIEPLPDAGFIAAYLCADCGHAWATTWKD